jgi:hypothetical protein
MTAKKSSSVNRRRQTLDFVLDTQLSAFDVRDFAIIHGGRRYSGMQLLLESDMLFLERFKMSLNSHLTLPSSYPPQPSIAGALGVNDFNVT